MTENTFSLVDARGRKHLTTGERERFLAAVRAHPKPSVQTLARTLAMIECRVSEALGVRECDVEPEAYEVRIATPEAPKWHWRAVPVRRTSCTPWISCTASGAPERLRRQAKAARSGRKRQGHGSLAGRGNDRDAR